MRFITSAGVISSRYRAGDISKKMRSGRYKVIIVGLKAKSRHLFISLEVLPF